jgi:hypothetical protein
LTLLPQDQRFAVLKKLNGTFGYDPSQRKAPPETLKPDQRSGKGGGKAKQKKASSVPLANKPKSSLNETFAGCAMGKLLHATSRAVQKAAKSKDEKSSVELHCLNRYLVDLRSKWKIRASTDPSTPLPILPFHDGIEDVDFSTYLLPLLSAIRTVCNNIGLDITDDASVASIIEAAWCLQWNQRTQAISDQYWSAITRGPRAEATLTVQRTDEEAAAARVRALERSRKRKETKIAKRAGSAASEDDSKSLDSYGDENPFPTTEACGEEGEETLDASMDMEEQDCGGEDQSPEPVSKKPKSGEDGTGP